MHNMIATPFDFIERAFLPIINRVGPQVSPWRILPGGLRVVG